MRAREILETALYVDDLEAAERFYTSVLGLRMVGRVAERHVFFRCGARVLLLFRPESTAAGGSVPGHGAHGPGHVAFAVVEAELEDWRAHLSERGVAIEMEYAWPRGGHSIYFRDPAGNSLELATPSVWGIDEAETLGPRTELNR
jgi:catechol 2,3-dioxygenase-like lactoylglutathione lyase family enzyme